MQRVRILLVLFLVATLALSGFAHAAAGAPHGDASGATVLQDCGSVSGHVHADTAGADHGECELCAHCAPLAPALRDTDYPAPLRRVMPSGSHPESLGPERLLRPPIGT